MTVTPEAQRIAIAEACPNIMFLNVNEGWCYRTSSKGEWVGCLNNDPLQDLNAMHEAEKGLKNHWFRYAQRLHDMTIGKGEGATAAQRAEAFLRTLGLWVDSLATDVSKAQEILTV